MTVALDGGERSASRPGSFTARERAPGTHWIGVWVGPRTVPDAVMKRKIPSLRRETNPRTLSVTSETGNLCHDSNCPCRDIPTKCIEDSSLRRYHCHNTLPKDPFHCYPPTYDRVFPVTCSLGVFLPTPLFLVSAIGATWHTHIQWVKNTSCEAPLTFLFMSPKPNCSSLRVRTQASHPHKMFSSLSL
jgi:hypothetical protein